MKKTRYILMFVLLITLAMWVWGADSDPWDGSTWDVTAPDIDQPIGDHYKEMYDLRKGVGIRMNKEHQDMATSSVGGWHTWGSANCYTGTNDPCNRPDNSTSLDSTVIEGFAIDWGRLWIDDNYDPPVLRRWNGTNFTEMVAAHLQHATAMEFILESTESLSTTDGTGDSKISAVGNKAAAGDCDLGYIKFSHDGTGADQKGVIDFVVNTGAEDNAPTGQVLELGSDLLATFSGAVTATGTLTASGTFAAAAEITVGTTLDVTGNIDPTTYETTNGGFLDEDDMSSDSATATASQQSVKAYVDAHGVVQVVNVTESTTTGCTTVLPCDDTTPAVAEGDEIFTLVITPTSATNKLLIQVVIQYESQTNNIVCAAALFNNANTCIAAAIGGQSNYQGDGPMVINHWMTSGAASELTFKVRVGPGSTGTVNVNHDTFGGVSSSSMTITEIKG